MQKSGIQHRAMRPGGGGQVEPWGQYLSVGGGAILTFAVDVTTSGFNLNTVGVILMVAGALGLVLSLLFWSSFSPYRRSRTMAGPDTVVEERRIERDLPERRSELLRLVPAGDCRRKRRVGAGWAPWSGRWSPPTRALLHASMRSP